MLKEKPRVSQTDDGDAVAWHAAIGDYRIVCTIVTQAGEPPMLSVVENDQHLEQQELAADASAADVEEAALCLRHRYESRISGVARRTWRFGRHHCLTTSWALRTPSPEDPVAA